MNATVQWMLTSFVVLAATSYATLKLMPRAWRIALAAGAASLAKRGGWSDTQVRRVEAKLSSGGACGSCDSCKACATPAAPTEEDPPAYRRIPIRTT